MNAPRKTIVIVDDEEEVLSTLQALLRRTYDVQTFTRAKDALAYLREHDVPVVLSDQVMPEMKGVEFLRHVKQLRPETTRLLFTAYSDISAVIAAINQGSVFRYISKPWDVDELQTTLRQAVEVHELVVQNRTLMEGLARANAQLTEANNLKSKFIEVASHELNTPVAIVVGLTELWRITFGENSEPTQRAWLERIEAAGKRLAHTVGRMLKLLQASQFDHTLDLHTVEVEPLVKSVVARLSPILEVRDQAIDVDVADDVGEAQLDVAKLDDMLTNLLFNAIKFTPDGETILLRVGVDAHEQIQFAVTDPGIGIGPQDRPHLFEPFYTSHDTLRHSSGEFQYGKRGIGLGLHLVKTFAELHGGSIDVATQPEKGSTFTLKLPRRPRPVTLPAVTATGRAS